MKNYWVLLLSMFLLVPFSMSVSAQTPSGSTTQFSLWYTNDLHTSNGTAFPTTLVNCLTVQDIRYVSGGVTPSSPGGRILIFTNEMNVPMNLSASIQNLAMPSNLQFNFYWGNYFGTNGNNNLTVPATQSLTIYFIAQAVAGGSYNSNGQWVLNYTWGASFGYSFDIILKAISSDGIAQQIIHVTGNDNYPQIGPQPTPTPTINPTPTQSTLTPTATATTSPTPTTNPSSTQPSPTPTATANPSPTPTTNPTQTPTATPSNSPTITPNTSASPTTTSQTQTPVPTELSQTGTLPSPSESSKQTASSSPQVEPSTSIPELSWLVILPLLIVIMSIALALKNHREIVSKV